MITESTRTDGMCWLCEPRGECYTPAECRPAPPPAEPQQGQLLITRATGSTP